ncbi:MAG TPA: hypothetical protein VFL51_09025, partial [Pseudolabrys sp.]|nr:hypothetical protein [Pseudolabrys sp.]
NVFPAHYKDDLLAFLRTYLNDPSHIKEAQVSAPVRKKMGLGERYITCMRFNARNADGKYLGSKESAAVYVDGKFNRYIDGGRDARESEAARQVKDLCKDVPLAPFPELEKLTR